MQATAKEKCPKKLFTLLDLCVSSLHRGHANLLCIVPILTDDPRRESNCRGLCMLRSIAYRRRPYRVECTGSLSTSEVKQRRARLVLGWGTAWEDPWVLSAFDFLVGTLAKCVFSGFRALLGIGRQWRPLHSNTTQCLDFRGFLRVAWVFLRQWRKTNTSTAQSLGF